MGFLANIPYITEAKAIKPKTIKKLNKELGFDLVERLMQVSLGLGNPTPERIWAGLPLLTSV